eukprot:TRINITY_DN122744_c0_g1_i1.p1 TRINITY_DN122744_c0_g1~~TRINITY_DN122744_c0_g1_i1.p1  ORF type:complete len:518 (-),score=100.90 TRINITY_DN122744_c0_g1_i1:201-1754(-)
MEAPDWFRTGRGPGAIRPPPPPNTTGEEPNQYGKAKPPPRPPPSVAKNTPPLPKPATPAAQLAYSKAAGQQSLVPALPPVPGVPGGPAQQQLALPGPLPPLAVLPPAPGTLAGLPHDPSKAGMPGTISLLPPDAAMSGISGAIALTMADDIALGGPGGMGGKAGKGKGKGANNQLARTAAAPKTEESHDKAFMIPGLQNRPYNEDELRVAFKMIDLSAQGFLRAADLRRLIQLCGDVEPTDAELIEMIRLCDPDGSGEVDEDEFMGAFMDPPALFRNFDFQRLEGLPGEDLEEEADSGSDESRKESRMTDISTSTPQPPPPDPRIEAVLTICGKKALKPDFIKQIYQRFIEIDTEEYGFVTFQAFCLCLKRAETSAMRKAFETFDFDHMGELDLRQFVVSMSMFTRSEAADKLRFAFMMYDEEQEETISRPELLDLLKAIAPHIYEEDRIRHANRMYAMHDLHPHMRIAGEEFSVYVLERAPELVPADATASSSRSSRLTTPTASSKSQSRSGSLHD